MIMSLDNYFAEHFQWLLLVIKKNKIVIWGKQNRTFRLPQMEIEKKPELPQSSNLDSLNGDPPL